MTKLLLLTMACLTFNACKQPNPKGEILDYTIQINDADDITFYLDETNLSKTLSLSLGKDIVTPLEIVTVPYIANVLTTQLDDAIKPTEITITAQNLGHIKLYLRAQNGTISNVIDIRNTTRKLDIDIDNHISAKVNREVRVNFTTSADNAAPYSVRIDDGSIVKAEIKSNNEVAITGLKKGKTELVIIDANGYESDTAHIDVQELDLAFTIKPTGTPSTANATQLILQLNGKFSNKTLAFTIGKDIEGPYQLITNSGNNALATFNSTDNSLSALSRGESVIHLVDRYGSKSNTLNLKVWDIQVSHEPTELTIANGQIGNITVTVTGEDAFTVARNNIDHAMRSWSASVTNPNDAWSSIEGTSLTKVFKMRGNSPTDTPDRFMSYNKLVGGGIATGGGLEIYDQTMITVK